MKSTYIRAFAGIFIAGILIISCGSGSNLNQLMFVGSDDEERLDYLLDKAQMEYNEGKFADAVKTMEKAERITGDSEKVLQLKAFALLGQGGFDPLSLVGKIIEQTDAKKGGNDTGDILASMSAILEVSTSDLEKLGTINDLPNNSILKGLPVLLPQNPGSHEKDGEPRAAVNSLSLLNKAIKAVCPLINPELLKTDDDTTPDRYNCTPFKGSAALSAQTYILFSLAHLIETLTFNLVLLYSPDSSSSDSSSAQSNSNIFKRIKKLEEAAKSSLSLSTIADYTEAVTEVVSNVAAIFNTSSGSMLYETMANLRKTVSAFGFIDGIPASFTEQVQKALSKIEDAATQAGSTINTVAGESNILKEKLGSQIVSKLNNQVDTFFTKVDEIKQNQDGGELTDCQNYQVSQMCTSMDTLLGGISSESLSSDCNDYQDVSDPGNCETPATTALRE